MKLHPVPARTGLLWVRLGARTFLRRPLALLGLFLMFMLVLSLLSLLPLIGPALAFALLPGLTLGLMQSAREAESGQFPMPTVLVTAFRGPAETVKPMLWLGGIYALGSLAVAMLASMLAGPDAAPLPPTGTGTEEELMQQAAALRAMLLHMVLYFPLALLFWHAPALVHWHRVGPIKSLFFSLMACWTNRGALVVYLLAWGLLSLACSVLAVLVGSLLGSLHTVVALASVVALVLSCVFCTSLYYTFRDSFLTDDGQPAA
jgi:hypothetical protein